MVVFALASVPIAIALAFVPHHIKEFILVKNKKYDNKKPRDVPSIDPDTDALLKNMTNCHYNQLESLGPYAAGIAAATAVGVAPGTLTAVSATYVGSRSAYILAYLSNNKMKGYHRSLAWVGAMGAIFWIWVAAAMKKAKDEEERSE